MAIYDTHQTLITTTSIPEHLIIQHILPRLPVKSLTRFKTVCKFWFTIISSSQFAQIHLKFSSLSPQFVILNHDHEVSSPCSDGFNLFLLPCDRNDELGDLIRLDVDRNRGFKVVDIAGCCNGLLCLYLELEGGYCSFCVWNPATNQCRRIKSPDYEYVCSDYGFGYASSSDDYKIVGIFSWGKLGDDNLYVFSLRTGEWKSIDGFNAAWSVNDVLIVINDALCWPNQGLIGWKKARCIFGLDLVDDKLKEIPWINCFNEYQRGDLFGIKGFVSFYCEGDQGSDVWVLKRYGDENSWEKRFSFRNLGEMSFLNFTETGKCLVESSGKLKVIGSSQESSDDSRVGGARFTGHITATGVYVESFVSPFVDD